MLKGYKYRIYPNKEQKIFFGKSFGSVRFIYNKALTFKKEQYFKYNKNITYFDLITGFLKNLKKEHDWLQDPPSQSLQMCLKHLDFAYNNFFKVKSTKFPKFKKKHHKQSLSMPQHVMVDFKRNKVKFPKIGEVFCVFHREFQGKIKTATVSKTSTDKYFVSILVDDEQELPTKINTPNKIIGIDFGIKDIIIDSNGNKISNPKYYNKYLNKIRLIDKKLSKKKKRSNNYKKLNKRRALLHEYVRNSRMDFLHKLSSKLIDENQVIFIEDLNIKNIQENLYKSISRNIGDTGWSILMTMLTYKANWCGKSIFKVNPRNTSKTCSNCGKINTKLKLSDRTWKCKNCNVDHDRDHNAAKNILRIGQELPEFKALNGRDHVLPEIGNDFIHSSQSQFPLH